MTEREDSLRRARTGEPPARATALRALRRWDDSEVLATLAAALDEPRRELQEPAAEALMEVGNAEAVRLAAAIVSGARPAAKHRAEGGSRNG